MFVLAMVMTARKLKAYFEAHPIKVLTDQPVKRVLSIPSMSGRLTGARETETQEVPQWKLYVDGASNVKGSRARILIKGPKGEIFEYAFHFSFKATNNKEEYEAMVTGLEIAQALKIKQLLVQGDSKFIIDQIRGDCCVKKENLGKYNAKALILDNPIHMEHYVRHVLEEVEDWRSPIARYLVLGVCCYLVLGVCCLPKRWRLGRWSTKASNSGSSKMSCINSLTSVPCYSVYRKNLQPVPRQPMTEMSPVVSAIPFAMWGIDLVGQFLKPHVKYKDVVVAIDYFNKWVKVAPLRSTTAEAILEFIWKNIITRYGIPRVLVSDNGP
ncbi:hypothetical protein LIER_07360 [Lithospermum erythrorhizon]|uniref:Integrase catalytic domain-containing protein n=1 Tax=Lithospermum erythrorhizon TaxID=34254 RepID=A0AAV3PCJ4_LITER